jgi:hypothetical protein
MTSCDNITAFMLDAKFQLEPLDAPDSRRMKVLSQERSRSCPYSDSKNP